MRCIVTGGAGFIGSHLVKFLLKKNFKVIVLDNLSSGNIRNISLIKDEIKFVNCDISKIGSWKKNFKDIDIVFHLAALADIVPSISKPEIYFKSNVTGTFNVVSLCREYNIKKLIYSASSSCYGIPKIYPTSEESQIDTRYPYALTKYLGECLVLHWSRVYKINANSLRLFNVYGPNSRTSGAYGAMFGVFLAQKLAKKPLTIVGDGEQSRDFIYVTDVVKAFYLSAISKINGKIINIGSGKVISVNKIANLISEKKTYIPKRPGEPDITHANISKAKKLLRWKPTVEIKEGVKLMLKEINYWKDAPVWTPNKIKVATRNWFKLLE